MSCITYWWRKLAVALPDRYNILLYILDEPLCWWVSVGTDLLVKNGSGDNDIIAGKDRNVDPSEPQDSYASVVRRKTDRRTNKYESHSSHTFN